MNDNLMNYRQAWEYLDGLQFFKIKLGLDSMERFLGRLGNPHHGIRFIHVAGTNGKGSTASALLAILAQAGYRVGLYTSPHLSCVRERFRIGASFISEEQFARHAAAIHGVLAGEQITYFEFATALALLWFAAEKVDLAIMEVGMGGRLDATNVITPLVGVITNVSMDHQAYLGNTLAEVAAEKAGIIKPGVPLVAGVAADDSRRVVEERCRQLAAPLYLLGRDFSRSETPVPGPGERQKAALASAGGQPEQIFNYSGIKNRFSGLSSPLRGHHQLDNISLALAALELLPETLPVDEEAIRAGLAKLTWPGRLELLQPPRAEGGTYQVLLDGAHNPAGVASLVAALQSQFRHRRLILVWASMADKDMAATLDLIAPLIDLFILTRPESERSATPEALLALLPEAARADALAAGTVAEALELARQRSGPDDLIVVAGSLYLVGAARLQLAGELVDSHGG